MSTSLEESCGEQDSEEKTIGQIIDEARLRTYSETEAIKRIMDYYQLKFKSWLKEQQMLQKK